MIEIKPGRYRHFKGNEYEVIGIAKHSETTEEMVVYRALYGEHGLWVRPASMWNEMVEHKGQIVRRFSFIEPEHYLFEIKNYLRQHGLQYECEVDKFVKARNAGKKYSLEEHIRGLVYALLTNQTKWNRITPHLAEIDQIFFAYAPEQIKNVSGESLAKKIFSLKCGNISTKAQMKALADNIRIFEELEKEYGSMDAFITSDAPEVIVKKLSQSNSPYKLHQVGEALAWEYIRNVGIDGAKPDTHIRRFLGSNRMGESKGKEATIEEALSQIERLSEETGLTKATVDNIIWSFCADGYGEVCTATPHCEVCPVKTWCKCK